MLRKAIVAGILLALFIVGLAVAAGEPSVLTFTYTTPDRVVTIPGETYTQSVTVPTVTVTVTEPATTTTAPTTTQADPPPVPPSGKQHIKGPILFRYANSWGVSPATYDRYGAVVVGFGDDAAAAALPNAKALTYKTMGEVFTECGSSDACLSGISASDATAAGVVLKNSSGQVLTGSGGGGNYYVADVGSTAYQNLWVQKVAARLASKGLDGVFIDNVLCNFVDELSRNGGSVKYPSAAAQRAAALSFVQNVGAQMEAKGFYVLANAFCYGGGGGDHAANTAWWHDASPFVSGSISETFEQNPSGSNYYDVRFDSPTTSWMGDWKGRLDVITEAQNAGRDAWELTSAVDSTSAAGKAVAKYACASFLLKWNGQYGGCGVNVTGPDPWDAAGWAFPIGVPTGAMTQSGGAYYRTFTGGKVIVNPSTSAVTVLGVTLAAKSAYIGV